MNQEHEADNSPRFGLFGKPDPKRNALSLALEAENAELEDRARKSSDRFDGTRGGGGQTITRLE